MQRNKLIAANPEHGHPQEAKCSRHRISLSRRVRSLAHAALLIGIAWPDPLWAGCDSNPDSEPQQQSCTIGIDRIHVGSAPILFLKPGETVKLDRKLDLSWAILTPALSPDLRFNWVVYPAGGDATPEMGTTTIQCPKGRVFLAEETFAFSYKAPGTEGTYALPVAVMLDPQSASAAGVLPSCRSIRDEWTVIVGGAEYGVTILGQYTEPGGGRAGLSVRGTFDVASDGNISGHAIHENWILGECVQYRDSMPQKISGWVEGDRIHLRFNKAGDATASTDNVNKDDVSCLFKGLKELGALLAMVSSDVAMQAGDGDTSTATLPGGLKIPGEVTFPLLKPGDDASEWHGDLRYSIRRRN